MNLAERDLSHIWHPCSQMKDYETFPPIIISHGKGVYLYDVTGKRYMDVISSWWCNLLGHCNAHISRAVKEQLDHLEHVIFANFSHEPAIRLCENLSRAVPQGLEKYFFTDNGSSAVEVALKMSFQYHYQTGNPEKIRFMALSDAYHGETLGALSVGGVDLYSRMYTPLLLEVLRVPGPDCFRCIYGKNRETCDAPCFIEVENMFSLHSEETAAIIVEPLVMMAAGMKIYPSIYLKKLRRICDAHNVHLITDEIATGMGRTGKLFACDHAEITPDFMCLSKGLTGGYLPMALVITSQKIYEAFYADYSQNRAFMHSHTFSGNPLACAAANAVMDLILDGNILTEAQRLAPVFNEMIHDVFRGYEFLGEIRSLGLINALELVADSVSKTPLSSQRRYGYEIYKRALSYGLILRPLGNVLYFNPPLNITESEMEEAVRICHKAVIEENIRVKK